jgi:TolA-binding protein
MEAGAIVGELQYQERDYAGAKTNFNESLDSSMKVADPNAPFMALDLYRTSEFAVREKDYDRARRQLQILIHRYPDSEWAARGRALLAAITKELPPDDEDSADLPADSREGPDAALGRIQSALQGRRFAPALLECGLFLRRHAAHASAGEVRLLRGALLLRRGELDAAVPELEAVARGGPAGLRSRAAYLLASAQFARGDRRGLRDAVADAPDRTDRWSLLAQAWRAADEDAEGRRESALARWRLALSAPGRSALEPFLLAALAAGEDALGFGEDASHDMRRAVEAADRAKIERLSSATRLSLGHVLARARRWKESAAAYADFAERFPDHLARADALYLQGLMLRRAGRPAEAAAAFEALLRKHASSVRASDAHLQLGLLRADAGKMADAASHFEKMARAAGADAEREKESVLLIAQTRYNTKDWKGAVELYRRFLAEHPGDARTAQVEELLLTSWWMQGARAEPAFLEVLDRRPARPVAARIRWELGREALTKDDCAAALSHLGRLVSDFPEDRNVPEALFKQAECLEKTGRPADAAALWKTLPERFPQAPQAREAAFRLGNAMLKSGDYGGSEAAYRRAEAGGDALAADALYNRALALVRAGRKEEGLEAFEKFLARFPSRERAERVWLETGTMREELGRTAAAAEAYAKVRSPELRAKALFGAARCREKLKQRALARRAYEELYAVNPATDALRLNGLLRLGLLYELDEEPLKAMSVYSELVRLVSDPALKKTALERLQDLIDRKAYNEKKAPAPAKKKGAPKGGKKAKPRA